MRGHCLCGGIAFEIDGLPQTCVVCHCESCSRQIEQSEWFRDLLALTFAFTDR